MKSNCAVEKDQYDGYDFITWTLNQGAPHMPDEQRSPSDLFKLMFQAHPWHGVSSGSNVPEVVNAYIEIVPTDAVKYELDKASGHLHVDRPQRFSSMCPSLYGFIPQTFAATNCQTFGRDSWGWRESAVMEIRWTFACCRKKPLLMEAFLYAQGQSVDCG